MFINFKVRKISQDMRKLPRTSMLIIIIIIIIKSMFSCIDQEKKMDNSAGLI